MRKDHDKIGALLPEYLQGLLSREQSETVERHLESCEECRDDLNIIRAIAGLEVPEPGDLFWQALPLKIRKTAVERRSNRHPLRALFRKPAWITAAVGVFLILALSIYLKSEGPMVDPYFVDPLAANVLDYGDIKEEDIPLSIGLLTDDDFFSQTGGSLEYSYSREIASLGSEDLSSLMKALMQERQNGG